VNSVAVDPSGNIYILGEFDGKTLTFETTELKNTGYFEKDDIFLAKYDALGNELWVKCIDGELSEFGGAVDVDPAGNVYITGNTTSLSLTFGSVTLKNADPTGKLVDPFIVKYDPDGNVHWAKSGSGTDDDAVDAMTVDASGNVYIAGDFYSSTLTFGSFTLKKTDHIDIYIVKYDTDGNVLWAKREGGDAYDEATSLTLDTAGNLIMAANFVSSSLTLGKTTYKNQGSDDIILAKYDTDGKLIWSRTAGGSGMDCSTSVTTDASGNIYLTGWYCSAPMTFETTALKKADNCDWFIAKYDKEGNLLWADSEGGSEDDYAHSITADDSGILYITGGFYTTQMFGQMKNQGSEDIFLVKFNSQGSKK
jgi:hypothetical protein